MVLDQYSSFHGLHHTFSLCTQTFPGIRPVNCYMLIKYEEELYIFLISREVPESIYLRKMLSHTTLIMLERAMYLAVILLLVQHRFQNLMVNIMQKYGQKIKVN